MEAPSFWPNIEEPPHDTTDDEWSFEEVKIFEKALEEFGLDSPGLFERIAARLPRKTETQVRNRWEMLLTEIEMIESGFIPIPHYTAAETTSTTTKSVPPVPVPVPVPLQSSSQRQPSPTTNHQTHHPQTVPSISLVLDAAKPPSFTFSRSRAGKLMFRCTLPSLSTIAEF